MAFSFHVDNVYEFQVMQNKASSEKEIHEVLLAVNPFQPGVAFCIETSHLICRQIK